MLTLQVYGVALTVEQLQTIAVLLEFVIFVYIWKIYVCGNKREFVLVVGSQFQYHCSHLGTLSILSFVISQTNDLKCRMPFVSDGILLTPPLPPVQPVNAVCRTVLMETGWACVALHTLTSASLMNRSEISRGFDESGWRTFRRLDLLFEISPGEREHTPNLARRWTASQNLQIYCTDSPWKKPRENVLEF